MELQATALKGIVRSSDEGLFYLFPIQDVSTLTFLSVSHPRCVHLAADEGASDLRH